MNLSLNHLLDYTEWQRKRWHDSLRNYGEPVLQIIAGPNGDGRFEVIGDLIRHIFSAEKRYVERLSGRALPIRLPSQTIRLKLCSSSVSKAGRNSENFSRLFRQHNG